MQRITCLNRGNRNSRGVENSTAVPNYCIQAINFKYFILFFFCPTFIPSPSPNIETPLVTILGGGRGISNSILHFVLLAKLILFATQFLLFLHALYKIQNTISDCFIRTTSISSILFLFSILKRSNKNSPWKFLYPTL